jgi:hypothetical protein
LIGTFCNFRIRHNPRQIPHLLDLLAVESITTSPGSMRFQRGRLGHISDQRATSLLWPCSRQCHRSRLNFDTKPAIGFTMLHQLIDNASVLVGTSQCQRTPVGKKIRY